MMRFFSFASFLFGVIVIIVFCNLEYFHSYFTQDFNFRTNQNHISEQLGAFSLTGGNNRHQHQGQRNKYTPRNRNQNFTKTSDNRQQKQQKQQKQHVVAGLSCDQHGGPSEEIASEMVYWNDIPSDAQFISPFKIKESQTKYLTFEPDEGGWNNIRMAMETAVATAHAMGRTLVMPPEQSIYLLGERVAQGQKQKKPQKNKWTYSDFFHFESIVKEHPGVDIISTQEFLEREIMTGNIKSFASGNVTFPPGNTTDFSGRNPQEMKVLQSFLRDLGIMPKWNFDKCIAVFPKGPGQPISHLLDMKKEILAENTPARWKQYTNKPTPVDASVKDRMREALAHRNDLCVYNTELQNAPVIHFTGDNASGARMLVHFYAFLFFEDWTHDLWSKRFIRDHVRYIDEIQCAAARVVNAIRQKSKQVGYNGTFDSFHIRRGDFQFQYKDTQIEASVIYDNTKSLLSEGYPVYIATDERNKTFFDPLAKHYKLFYLDDFKDVLEGFNTNYYGMLDQLIASRGQTFIGTFFSTFTGYIHRVRGHHYQKEKLPGYMDGNMKGYYHVPKASIYDIDKYKSVTPPLWAREFPVGWRDIDKSIGKVGRANSPNTTTAL